MDRSRRLSLPRRVVCVAVGLNHSLAVDECGKLFSWGSESAPLGYEAAAPQLTPRRVCFSATRTKGVDERVGVVSAAATDHHNLAVSRDGCVFAWGTNARGQLGMPTGAENAETTPRRVDSLRHTSGDAVVGAAAGSAHSACVCRDGAVWAWGFDRPAPSCVRLSASPHPDGTRSHTRRPKPLAVQLACGDSHAAAVATNGSVFVWDESLSAREVRLPGRRVAQVAAARYST